MKARSAYSERRRSSVDIDAMQKMRDAGASYADIGAEFDLHHTTVMHHLNMLHASQTKSSRGWSWSMTPHEIRTAQVMRANGASFSEIGRALEHSKVTVERTLQSPRAQRDVAHWFLMSPIPPPQDGVIETKGYE